MNAGRFAFWIGSAAILTICLMGEASAADVGCAKAAVSGDCILNLDISSNDAGEAASVPDLAVDPRDARHVVAVWRTIEITKQKDAPRSLICHMAVSRDGGASFSRQVINWGMPDTPMCNAPYVDFGAHGELFIGATLIERGPLNPPEGWHAFGRAVIRKSADGGRNWAPTTGVIDSNSLADGRFASDPSIPEQTMKTPWDGARGIVNRSNGDIYVAGGYPAAPGGATHAQRFYAVSRDGGGSWSAIRAMGSADWPQRWDGRIVAAPGKMALAYVAAAAPGVPSCLCVVFATSTDGTDLKRVLVTQVGHVDTLVHYPPLAADSKRARTYAIALVSDDRAALDVFASSDAGTHWNKIVIAAPKAVVRMSRPAIAYMPNETLVAMWRGAYADGSYDVFMAAARDGRHFGEPVRITTAASRIPDNLKSDYAASGDFLNVVRAGPDAVHAVWTDWRSRTEARVFYSRVPLSSLVHVR